MSKYLGFSTADCHCLINATEVVEVYDESSSPEPIEKVLARNSEGDAFWRGARADYIDMTALLDMQEEAGGNVLVCLKSAERPDIVLLVRFSQVHELYDVNEQDFMAIDIPNQALAGLAQKVCLLAGKGDAIWLVLKPVAGWDLAGMAGAAG